MINLNRELTASGAGAKVTNANTITVGSNQWGSFPHKLNASLDEMAIWDTALTSDQIADIYASGKITNLSNLDTSSNLKIWWRFGDGSGDDTNIVYDQAGSANLTCYDMDASNRINGVPASPSATSAYALNSTARQHQGDLFIKLPAYNSTTSAVVDTFEQLRTGEIPVPVVIEEEAAFKNIYSYSFPDWSTGVGYGYSGTTVSGIPGPGGYSFSVWAKASWLDINYGGFFALYAGATQVAAFWKGQGQHHRYLFITENSTDYQTPHILTVGYDNVWIHLIVTSDTNTTNHGALITVYINGAVAHTTPPNSGGISGVDSVKIGRYASWGEYGPGLMDEAAIYDTALSLSQVEDIYSSGKSVDLTGVSSSSGNLKHWWRFGDTAGDDATMIVNDVVGSAHLTMSGFSAPHGRVEDAPEA